METVRIINWNKKETEYKVNLATLSAHARQNGGVVNFRIGNAEYILKIIEKDECDKCGQEL